MSKQSKPAYKPLTFTTTVRSPKRIKGALKVIAKYEGQILTNELSITIFKDVIKEKKYEVKSAWKNPKTKHLKSKYQSDETFTDEELDLIVENNPQDHKERDFQYGYPSRFHTFFDIHRQFGFFFYKRPGLEDEFAEEIRISPLGKRLLTCDEDFVDDIENFDSSELEANIFAHAMAKYHGNNPFIKRKNRNVPLILLMNVIKLLNADKELEGKGVGISRKEIALFLVWKDEDAHSLFKKIKEIRLNYPLPTSDEVILDSCDEHEPRWNNWQDKTLIKDVPDEFIRKMRITGLFALRGAGRYLDINRKKEEKINYILSNYEECRDFSGPIDYYNYCSRIDKNILELEDEPILLGDDYRLDYWINHYPIEVVNQELINLTNKNPSSKDPILRTMDNPVRLEFLCTLVLKHQLQNVEVIPRYKIDDEGVPYTHAPSNGHDIECKSQDKAALIEVTLMTTGQQVHSEGPQTLRHLKTYKESNSDKEVTCWFVAPSIHEDFLEWAEFQNNKNNGYLTFCIDDFVNKLENESNLYISFHNQP